MLPAATFFVMLRASPRISRSGGDSFAPNSYRRLIGSLSSTRRRYPIAMQFCPWYPLGDAERRSPLGEGVLQVRLAGRLLDYPTGMSAMVHYEHAADVRASAVWLAERFAGLGLLCRHFETEGEPVD